ncbi:DUF4199 domain-containing protein [Labilibacter marinus]|uniref:DUF4199 domain-containing protein n=1 Tax=Labilibacter marinus TaxID=1477105 RepID=UPI00083134F9|nr:DUF4199 domain-containing protein [Labilibacter marinus]
MEQSASKSSTVYGYGLYLGIASIVYFLMMSYSGLMGNKALGLLGLVLMIVFIVLGLNNYKKKENKGFLGYGQGVGIGTLISLVGGVVSSIFTYVFYAFIDPAKHTEYLAIMQEEQMKAGVSEAQLEQMEGMMSIFQGPMAMAIMGIFSSVIVGLIISLIVSAILKKDAEPAF